MVNRITRILALAALCAAPGTGAFAQAYAVDGPVPAYPPDVYRAQDADGGHGVVRSGPSQAHDRLADRDDGRSDHARYDRDGYDLGSRRGLPQGRALEDRRAQRQGRAYDGAYRQAEARRAERVETSYRFLSWSGKVEERDGYAYSESSDRDSDRRSGPRCPSVQTGERVLDCRYIPFAEPEPQGAVLSSLYIDGGVGPNVIGGGGGGGGGPSNGQIFLGTGFSGVSVPTYTSGGGNNGGGNGGGSGNGSGSGSGSGSGTGVGTGSGSGIANSSSSSSSSASASVSASLSSSITIGGGFFIHGGGGHWGGGGGKPGGCGCGSGGGGMSGWGGGGHKK